jgi:hypothetical protein
MSFIIRLAHQLAMTNLDDSCCCDSLLYYYSVRMELSATSLTALAPVLKDGRVLIALRELVLISCTDPVAHKFALAHPIIPNCKYFKN